MTICDAAKYLEGLFADKNVGDDIEGIVQEEIEAAQVAVWLLHDRMRRDALQPLDENGLAMCGCGGKAQIINSSGYSRRLYVECDRCAIMLGVEATGDGALQGIYRYDDQIIKDWNRAMGYREEEGHD